MPDANVITQNDAIAIYSVLLDAGARVRDAKQFYQVMTAPEKESFFAQTEFRFQGNLGFGGKFRNYSRRQWYVDCYQEDLTPEREEIIKKTNERLAVLWEKRENLRGRHE